MACGLFPEIVESGGEALVALRATSRPRIADEGVGTTVLPANPSNRMPVQPYFGDTRLRP